MKCQFCYTDGMLGFNHVLAGSLIAVITPAPMVPLAAFGSHFILDLFPHFGNSTSVYPYTKSFKLLLVADALLCIAALSLALLLFPDKWFIIMVGAFFGALPDFFWLAYHRGSKWIDTFLGWAEWIQWGERPYGWMFDAFYGFAFAFILVTLAT